MAEPIFERVLHDIEHGITSRIPHHRYHGQHEPAQAAPQEDPMSALAEKFASIKDAAENAAEWIRQELDTHLPAAEAELAKLNDSAVAQALEAVVLTPAEEAMVAKIITELPTLRVSESVPAASDGATQAEVPADGSQDTPATPEPVAAAS